MKFARFCFSAALITGALALSQPAFAQNNQGQNNNSQGRVRGAPGPLVGAGIAGLPVLLVAGGIYWIVRRRKKPN